jgi:hypothetical protein
MDLKPSALAVLDVPLRTPVPLARWLKVAAPFSFHDASLK